MARSLPSACILLAPILVYVCSASDDRGGMWSPHGSLTQVEYAQKAVDRSHLCVGIKCRDGVILGSRRLMRTPEDKLREPLDSIHQVNELTAMVSTGIASDARALLITARQESALFKQKYGVWMRAPQVADAAGSEMHAFARGLDTRPLAANLIIADCCDGNPELLLVDTSGSVVRRRVCAVGEGAEEFVTKIVEFFPSTEDGEDILCQDCISKIEEVLRNVPDEPFIELAWLRSVNGGLLERVQIQT